VNKLKALQCLNVMNDEYRRIAQTPRDDPGARKFIMAYDEIYREILLAEEASATDVNVIAILNRRVYSEN
jgi:hypothetical protein